VVCAKCCVLYAVCCMLYAVCCVLYAVLLYAVCFMLSAVCCMTYITFAALLLCCFADLLLCALFSVKVLPSGRNCTSERARGLGEVWRSVLELVNWSRELEKGSRARKSAAVLLFQSEEISNR
jgi:hypothetical protein